jgi:hypothetical protein
MSAPAEEFAVRAAAWIVVAALVLAMASQLVAPSQEDGESSWLIGSRCARPAAPGS